ncbi:MAG: hypothetical protein H6Q89_5510 [Myxococcaceae bacterium]|nr:hypothetical protein [Myxococcaceae bacterium]
MAAWAKALMVLVVLAAAGGCTDQKQKMAEAQKARAEAKKAFEAAEEARRNAGKPKIEPAKLEPFWADPAYLRVKTGKPCPEGMWALFPETPGEGAEKEANEARRAELAAKVRGSTFVAVLPFDTGVTLRKYNAKKKALTVQVDGVMECFDGLGLLAVAWGDPAKAVRPPQPDDDEEEATQQAVWRAQPLTFALPFRTAAEAQAFRENQGVGLEARIVFTLGKIAIDKRGKKGEVDWGAGRLVHVDLVGVRIATDHEKLQLAELRKK